MKKLFRVIKWFIFILIGILLVGIIIIAIIGFPKPKSIVGSDNIPRIPWSSVYDNFMLTKNFVEGSILFDWLPNGNGIYLLSQSGFLQRSFSEQSSPDSSPIALEEIPVYADEIFVNPAIDKNFLIISLDDDGDEQYQLYRYDLKDKSLEQITDGEGNCIGAFFNAKGDKFLYANNKRNSKYFDFYLIEPENPDSNKRIFTSNKFAQFPLAFSPISENTLLVKDWRKWTAKRLYILEILSGEITLLEPDTTQRINHGTDYFGAGSPAVWSQDGKLIYYISDKNSEFQQLYRYNIYEKTNKLLIDHITWDIVDLNITPDRNKIIYKTLEDGLTKVYTYNISLNESKQLKIPWGFVRDIKVHPDKNILAINLYQTFFQTDIISYNLDTDKIDHWYQKERDITKPEKIYYATYDSINGSPIKIPAYVFKPKSSEKPYPVLIELHGGPVSHSPFVFFDLYKGLFDMGIAIISPNFRGSLGYGKSFELADNGYNRLNAVEDVGALLDWIQTQPDLDANRIGVIGSSFGGYLALSTLAKYSDKITCGIDAFGVSNIATLLENSLDSYRDVRRSEMGDERILEMRRFLESIAPVNNAENISAPLFVYQGLKDTRVHPSESNQIVKAVKENGEEVWYIVAENEGHGISHPLNMLYTTNAYHLFLKKYLLDK
ncbi:prolyl oligopeptidase family serine peptidase [Candidatus Neomarinimicrobiota bacterium]